MAAKRNVLLTFQVRLKPNLPKYGQTADRQLAELYSKRRSEFKTHLK